jgi:uncharacterized protein YjbJ (UPF0337 family)
VRLKPSGIGARICSKPNGADAGQLASLVHLPISNQLENHMSGTTDKIKGRVKEAIGALTNDKRLKNEGKVDQASGAIKDGIGKVVDKVKGAASPRRK